MSLNSVEHTCTVYFVRSVVRRVLRTWRDLRGVIHCGSEMVRKLFRLWGRTPSNVCVGGRGSGTSGTCSPDSPMFSMFLSWQPNSWCSVSAGRSIMMRATPPPRMTWKDGGWCVQDMYKTFPRNLRQSRKVALVATQIRPLEDTWENGLIAEACKI